jgi:L-2-hydroxyglutarate oxidase
MSSTLSSTPFDAVIIGGGAVGLATAMALSTVHARRVAVVEAEPTLAAHQTGNNSGVIHSGLYYKPGSLKARLCCEGRELMYRFCLEHGVPHERCGKIVVATSEPELGALTTLEQRGAANGLAKLRRLTIDELREHEPHVAGIAGIHVVETGIVDYKRVTSAYADVVRRTGGTVQTSARAVGIRRTAQGVTVETTAGTVHARVLVNCAGLHSDRVAKLAGVDPGVKIVPFRGEYYTLKPSAAHLVKHLIYPVPNPAFPFLGVHYTRMIGGGIEAGPNAVLALSRHGYSWTRMNLRDMVDAATFPGLWKLCRKHWSDGLGEVHRSLSKAAFVRALQKLLPEITSADLEPGGAGVRAQAMEPSGALVDDFRILETPNMVHVLNAPSPAATASIAIGRHIGTITDARF